MMAEGSRKRPAPSDDDQPPSKRLRASSVLAIGQTDAQMDQPPNQQKQTSTARTLDAIAKNGLRRTAALVLDKIGFDGADEVAMESFVHLTEKYLESLAEEVKAFTNTARRTHPIPTDFETSLKRFNVTTSALRPHLKPPVPRSRRQPKWEALPADDASHGLGDLPILGAELDGAVEKATQAFIPSSFPSFPSIHTYRYTPESAEAVTVSEPTSFSSVSDSSRRPLAPDEIPRGDPKKIREAAAKEAKQSEEALRGLMRASKIARQKEVCATAQLGKPARRERYDLWEAAMRESIGEKGDVVAVQHGAMGRFEIADHSMIVNAEGQFARKQVQRACGRKSGLGDGVVGKG